MTKTLEFKCPRCDRVKTMNFSDTAKIPLPLRIVCDHCLATISTGTAVERRVREE